MLRSGKKKPTVGRKMGLQRRPLQAGWRGEGERAERCAGNRLRKCRLFTSSKDHPQGRIPSKPVRADQPTLSRYLRVFECLVQKEVLASDPAAQVLSYRQKEPVARTYFYSFPLQL